MSDDRRQAGDLERLLDRPLDVPQQPVLARLDQGDRHALASGAPGPPDAVDVRVRRGGHVVVDDVGDVLDVEAAGRHVGRDEDVQGALAEAPHDLVALLLREAAVEGRRITAASAQGLGKIVHLAARPGEDERGGAVLEVQDAAQCGELVGAPDDVGHLSHAGGLALGRPLGLDPDARRLAEVRLGHAGDGPGDRGGEERRLAVQGQGRQDLLEVVGEAHVEHLVRLVEDHHLHLVEADRAAVEVVHAAPGRGHHHVHAARQAVELGGDRLAAVDGHHAHAQLAAVLVHGLGHLHRELASRREDQRRRPAGTGPLARDAATVRGAAGLAIRIQAQRETLEHRERECRGLAGARGRLGEEVLPLEQGRDRGELDGGGLLVAERGERVQETGVEGEGGEARGVGGGFGHG